MKPIYSKMLFLVLLVFVIFNFSIIANSSMSKLSQNSNKTHILVIYDEKTYFNALNLYNERLAINETQLNATFVDIKNDQKIQSLVSSQMLGNSYDEFWLISDQISEQGQISNLLEKILNINLPTIIWTKDLAMFDASIKTELGITSCNLDPKSIDQSNFTLKYDDITNLSSLLQSDLPNLQSISGPLEIGDCSLSSHVYKLISLKDYSSTAPLLYQPFYKSKILVAPFYLNSNIEDINSTNTNSTNLESSNISSFGLYNNNIQFNSFNSNQSISTSQLINFNYFVSYYTVAISLNWNNLININNSNSGSNNITTSNNDIFSFLQDGLHIPNIDPKLANTIAVGTVGIGLLSFIVLLLKRYWLSIVLAIIGIFAVFKVPTRKISVIDVYHNETRQNIIDILNYKKSQGETVRNLSRELNIPLPTLLWHLQILEEFELIIKIKVKREIVIIALEFVEEFDLDLKIFEMTFKSDKAKIFFDYLLNLKENEHFSISSVLNHTSWSSRTVLRYITKLLELGIIEQNQNTKKYTITPKFYFKIKELN